MKHELLDNERPYSVTGVSDREPGRVYWVPYCPLFATEKDAETHARNVWGSDWAGKRGGIQLSIGRITRSMA